MVLILGRFLLCHQVWMCPNTVVFLGAATTRDLTSVEFYLTIHARMCFDTLREMAKVPSSAVPTFPPESLEYRGVDDSNIARQGFGRGLCMITDQVVAIGSSPSTISIMDLASQRRLTGVNLTLDIRNAIHGLECWPERWTRGA